MHDNAGFWIMPLSSLYTVPLYCSSRYLGELYICQIIITYILHVGKIRCRKNNRYYIDMQSPKKRIISAILLKPMLLYVGSNKGFDIMEYVAVFPAHGFESALVISVESF